MEEKRRLQNRLNQRAHRARKRTAECVLRGGDSGRPYDLRRWRVKLSPEKSISGTEDETNQSSKEGSVCQTVATVQPCTFSADHKYLPLVLENVFRGLWLNKLMLRALTRSYIPVGTVGGLLPSPTTYPGHAALVPMACDIPADMIPTWTQQSVAHCSMIDHLPCPRMRDNIINSLVPINHQELVMDMLGTVLDLWKRTLPGHLEQNPGSDPGGMMQSEVVGFMVWGDPHLLSSWEVTPGFVNKWGWLLGGCDELMRSTQRWRAARGEPLLSLDGNKVGSPLVGR